MLATFATSITPALGLLQMMNSIFIEDEDQQKMSESEISELTELEEA